MESESEVESNTPENKKKNNGIKIKPSKSAIAKRKVRPNARFALPSPLFMCEEERPNADLHLSRREERYLSQLSTKKKENLLLTLREATAETSVPLRFRVLNAKHLPNKAEILQKFNTSDHGGKMESWFESLLTIPFQKFSPPPSSASNIERYLSDTRHAMDKMVHGQHEAKDELMRLLCQWSMSGGLSSFAIALEGPPGTGKTTFAKNVIAKVMNRPFEFIGLGGATDSNFLLGHSFTYEGAVPGKITECLRTAKVMNPCFYFDELDKISKTPKGDELANVLVHLADREQNNCFHDRFYNGIDFDISQSLFVFSYNDVNSIPPVLLERLNVIKFQPPTVEEKVEIAQTHLLPKAISACAMSLDDLSIDNEVMQHIIQKHTNERGVRGLEKCLCRIVSTMNVMKHAPNVLTSIDVKQTSACTASVVDAILGSKEEDRTYIHTMYT